MNKITASDRLYDEVTSAFITVEVTERYYSDIDEADFREENWQITSFENIPAIAKTISDEIDEAIDDLDIDYEDDIPEEAVLKKAKQIVELIEDEYEYEIREAVEEWYGKEYEYYCS